MLAKRCLLLLTMLLVVQANGRATLKSQVGIRVDSSIQFPVDDTGFADRGEFSAGCGPVTGTATAACSQNVMTTVLGTDNKDLSILVSGSLDVAGESNYGHLVARGRPDVKTSAGDFYFFSISYSNELMFSDSLRVLGGPANGFIEILAATSLSGGNGDSELTGQNTVSVDGTSVVDDIVSFETEQHTFVVLAPVVFGTNIVLSGALRTQDRTTGQVTNDLGGLFYRHDLSLTRIRFLDSDGSALSGLRYTSGSGTRYQVEGATFVPEPGSALLAGTSLFIVLTAWLRHRRVSRGPAPNVP